MPIDTRYGILQVPDTESDIIGRFLARYGEWAWIEVCFVADLLFDNSRILDIGAFVGTFSLGLALRKKLSCICAVEANGAIVPLLTENLRNNCTIPTITVESLVTNTNAGVLTGRSQLGNLGSMTFTKSEKKEEIEEYIVPSFTTTLADLRSKYGKFDLIKIDAEGMELDILLGDASHICSGDTVLWIECNEDHKSLEVCELLLSWGLDIYYFAFPSYNPDNYKGHPDPIFPFAFEAGLLVAPKAPPVLNKRLQSYGCLLSQITSLSDLKTALWRTPRWGFPEWNKASREEIVALSLRQIRGETYDDFLLDSGISVAQKREEELFKEREEISRLQGEVQTAQSRITEREKELRKEKEEISHLQKQVQVAQSTIAEQEEKLQVQQEHINNVQEALATTKDILNRIEGSTTWRVTAPVRRFFAAHPALYRLVSFLRRGAGKVRRTFLVHFVADDEKMPIKSDDFLRTAVESLFDANYYLCHNLDVRDAGVDPLDHYLNYGWMEDRNPSPFFNTRYYLESNPDVSAAGINPLYHYAVAGVLEGRLPQPPLAIMRKRLECATTLRTRVQDWLSGSASVVIQQSNDLRLFDDSTCCANVVVSLSHDDYAVNFGGIQNVIGDEQRAFNAAGWSYLHLSPARPIPILADPVPEEDFLVSIRFDGKAIGIARFSDVLRQLFDSQNNGSKFYLVVHHLMGHCPEIVAQLATVCDSSQVIVWIHDFFTLCPSYTLLRNDIVFCGSPGPSSPACQICCYGEERMGHLERIRQFFANALPAVLAPSESALGLWQRGGDHHVETTAIVPLCHLNLTNLVKRDPDGGRARPLRVAFLGTRVFHKGWTVFEELASRHIGDERYKFLQFGIADSRSIRNICHVEVHVDGKNRNAMVDALISQKVDVVIIWSLWPETFCFTVHEALASGAFVVTRREAGNVWPTVEKHYSKQGCVLDSEEDLYSLFASDGLIHLLENNTLRRGTITIGHGTADFLLLPQHE